MADQTKEVDFIEALPEGYVVSEKQAKKEVEAWLNYKKVSLIKRKNYTNSIEVLTLAICEGNLSFDTEKNKFVQTLKFPVGSNGQISTIEFESRLSLDDITPYLESGKETDSSAKLKSYIAALTKLNKAVISKFDSEDLTISENIAVFFL